MRPMKFEEFPESNIAAGHIIESPLMVDLARRIDAGEQLTNDQIDAEILFFLGQLIQNSEQDYRDYRRRKAEVASIDFKN